MNNITKIVFCLSFVVLAAWMADAEPNYCDKSLCPDGGEHIACNHNNQFSSKCPKDAKMVEFTPALQELIVDTVNKKRNFVAGGKQEKLKPACRMATMQWNADLAKIAALNVKKCELELDECHNTAEFPYSGQNLALLSFYGTANDTAKLLQAINTWYSELEFLKTPTITSYPKPTKAQTTGHFTALVADRNIAIGCAASTFPVDSKSYSSYLVACNMAFTNMIGTPVYKTCPLPGTKCMGENPKWQNLCDTSEEYLVNGF